MVLILVLKILNEHTNERLQIYPHYNVYASNLEFIFQGTTTVGYCRYRQAVPIGQGGRLDIDANYGIRKAFLPQVQICIAI